MVSWSNEAVVSAESELVIAAVLQPQFFYSINLSEIGVVLKA